MMIKRIIDILAKVIVHTPNILRKITLHTPAKHSVMLFDQTGSDIFSRMNPLKRIFKMENYENIHHYVDNDYEKPKEMFIFLGNLIEESCKEKTNINILDVGCAKGDFLYFLKNRLSANKPNLFGVDFSQMLINIAKSYPGLNDVEFMLDNGETFHLNKKFDFIIASGIICCFDDYTLFLDNLLRHLAKDGTIIITAGFNPYGYDIIVKYKEFSDNARTTFSVN